MASNSNILQRVEMYISQNIPLNKTDKILVGLSGGADSVALLSILKELGYSCIAAHCHFGLRGAESDRDRDFAEAVSKQLQVPFVEVKFDTLNYAAQKKVSVEMACRELRYEWFEQQRNIFACRYLAVAHHRDDSVETVLINLIRGTGIAGLTGIAPINGAVIRPLLSLSRLEIEEYLTSARLSHVTDSTNAENIYVRNRIRNRILPLMKNINPSVYDAITSTATHLREAEIIYREAVNGIISEVVEEREGVIYIDMERLMQHSAPRTILYEIVKPYGFITSQLDDIIMSFNESSGKRFFSSTHRIIKDRKYLICSEVGREDNHAVYYPAEQMLDINIIQAEELPPFTRNKNCAYFDADKLPPDLIIRRWRTGDKFMPFGMRGTQKLSDYFTTHKYSILQKEQAWLMVADNDILWIVGERQSDKYKVTPETKRVAKITIRG